MIYDENVYILAACSDPIDCVNIEQAKNEEDKWTVVDCLSVDTNQCRAEYFCI